MDDYEHRDQFADHPVRPYVWTSGRAHPSRNTIRPETLLVVDPDLPFPVSSTHQQRELLDMCRGVLSLAEAAAHLKLPVSLVLVLASDLVDSGHLSIRSALPQFARPDHDLLEKVLNGLRKLCRPAAPERYLAPTVAQSVKILVVGAFGVGKTTMIGSVSEIPPLRTEETMTTAGVGIDPAGGPDGKTTTTVAMDFGRITVSPDVVLYLFGTPGQRRFWDLWEGLAEGAVGVLVLVDTRRLEDSFEVLDQLELRTSMPFAVAVNEFPDAPRHPAEPLREALDLLPETPIVMCDARSRDSAARALITLVEHALKYSNSPKALT